MSEASLVELLRSNIKVTTRLENRTETFRDGGEYYGTTYVNNYEDLVTEVLYGDVVISSERMTLRHIR